MGTFNLCSFVVDLNYDVYYTSIVCFIVSFSYCPDLIFTFFPFYPISSKYHDFRKFFKLKIGCTEMRSCLILRGACVHARGFCVEKKRTRTKFEAFKLHVIATVHAGSDSFPEFRVGCNYLCRFAPSMLQLRNK